MAKQAKDPEQYHGRIRLGSEGGTDPSARAEGTPPPARSAAVEAANWTASAPFPHNNPHTLLLAVASRGPPVSLSFFFLLPFREVASRFDSTARGGCRRRCWHGGSVRARRRRVGEGRRRRAEMVITCCLVFSRFERIEEFCSSWNALFPDGKRQLNSYAFCFKYLFFFLFSCDPFYDLHSCPALKYRT